jgi:hypothetical protein
MAAGGNLRRTEAKAFFGETPLLPLCLLAADVIWPGKRCHPVQTCACAYTPSPSLCCPLLQRMNARFSTG